MAIISGGAQIGGGVLIQSWNPAVATYGYLYTWGANDLGVLGNGSTANTSSPGTVAGGGTAWSSVGGGQFSTMAIQHV
jgi:hypothetical protein